MKDALLNRKDLNVILVDWSKGAGFPYGQASGNTRLVGAQIAELIRFLITSTKSPSSFASILHRGAQPWRSHSRICRELFAGSRNAFGPDNR